MDDRGRFFFIISRVDNRVTFESFGHPEWPPDEQVGPILWVEPRMFFRISGDPSLYLFVEYSAGWESEFWGIIDVRRGRRVLESP
jgi:hypothetical protein